MNTTYDDLGVLLTKITKAKSAYDHARLELMHAIQAAFPVVPPPVTEVEKPAAKAEKDKPLYRMPDKVVVFHKHRVTPAQMLLLQYIADGSNTRQKLLSCPGIDANNLSRKLDLLCSADLIKRRQNMFYLNKTALSEMLAVVEAHA